MCIEIFLVRVYSALQIDAGNKVLVVSGYNGNPQRIVEVLDVENGDNQCSNIGNLPYGIPNAVGGLAHQTYPVICGGGNSDSCLVYRTHVWNEVQGAMQLPRGHAAGIFVNPSTLFIAGGEGKGIGATSELLTFDENGHFVNATVGPVLPHFSYSHCMVQISASEVMVMGGTLNEKTYFLNVERGNWTAGPSLYKYPRFGCGLFRDIGNNHRYVIVGTTNDSPTVEILDLNEPNGMWKFDVTIKFPVSLRHAEIVTPNGYAAYFMGGYGYQKEVYKIQCFNKACELTNSTAELGVPRGGFVSMIVPGNFTYCSLG